MSTPILFYDIASTLPTQAWSPNTWKTRPLVADTHLILRASRTRPSGSNMRKSKLGAKRSERPQRGKKPDGSPNWTLPMIHDLSTGAIVADSTKIAAYLDATYPDMPRLMPPGTFGLFRSFESAVLPALNRTLYQYGIPGTDGIFSPPNQVALRRKREA
ncbi:Glutathione S-transferase-like protein ustS [Mycena venus]|uniref:Glutathione S-transferase-like protein ustS n=1 Tax=Mycena venus TaxID=2733690 RepID=A0A8H6Y1X6_9AGAR|nr:Glutathione S-transferase-like protein ustS [Mycena venus]